MTKPLYSSSDRELLSPSKINTKLIEEVMRIKCMITQNKISLYSFTIGDQDQLSPSQINTKVIEEVMRIKCMITKNKIS